MSQNRQCNHPVWRGDQEVLCGRRIWYPAVFSINHQTWTKDWCTPHRRAFEDHLNRPSPASAYVPVGDVEMLAEYYDLAHRSSL